MFYGWKLALLGFYGNLMIQGGGVYIMNALMEPLGAMHGWTRGTMGTSLAIASCAGMISISIFSSLALHMSLRMLMVIGALMGSLGFWTMGRTDNLTLFTVALAAVWVGGQACGGAVANALMSNWFVRHRGKAFGLVNMGTSMSGAVLPLGTLILLHWLGVSTATTLLAAATLILVPLSLCMVRESPESMQLLPDGNTTSSLEPDAHSNTVAPRIVIPWKELIRTLNCYRIGLIFGLGLMVVAGVVGQLKPRFSDLGFTEYVAMSLMALTALCAALGKYIWGWVTDKMPPIRATQLLIVCTIIGLFFAFLPSNTFTVLLFAIYTGSCVGGFWTVFPAVTAAVFGREAFVSAYRFLSIFVVMKSFGYYVMGLSYDFTQSYDAGFMFFIACLSLAFLLSIGLKSKAPQADTASPASPAF